MGVCPLGAPDEEPIPHTHVRRVVFHDFRRICVAGDRPLDPWAAGRIDPGAVCGCGGLFVVWVDVVVFEAISQLFCAT